mgnify:CR=1 FL=1
MLSTRVSQSQPPRILVVEDDDLQQEILRSALTRQGYEVTTASDGLDAVWKVREGSYNLVLVDFQIPEIDGLATARLMRDLKGEAACPVLIALTAAPDRLTDRDARSGSAFDDVIAKPVELSDLISSIERHLSSAPDSVTLQGAESALLLKIWTEYDGNPDRLNSRDGKNRSPRILIVEDDNLQQLILRSALESRGYVVEAVSEGLQAVRMIRDNVYDLVLIDYQLPELDGLAVARLIQDLMPDAMRPRMVALTSAPSHLIERQKSVGNAFDEIVAKSADLAALLATVDRHLHSSSNSATRQAMKAIGSFTAGA